MELPFSKPSFVRMHIEFHRYASLTASSCDVANRGWLKVLEATRRSLIQWVIRNHRKCRSMRMFVLPANPKSQVSRCC